MEKKEKQTKLIRLNDIILSKFSDWGVMALRGDADGGTNWVNYESFNQNLSACS